MAICALFFDAIVVETVRQHNVLLNKLKRKKPQT